LYIVLPYGAYPKNIAELKALEGSNVLLRIIKSEVLQYTHLVNERQ
jgi:hypothetical protein